MNLRYALITMSSSFITGIQAEFLSCSVSHSTLNSQSVLNLLFDTCCTFQILASQNWLSTALHKTFFQINNDFDFSRSATNILIIMTEFVYQALNKNDKAWDVTLDILNMFDRVLTCWFFSQAKGLQCLCWNIWHNQIILN